MADESTRLLENDGDNNNSYVVFWNGPDDPENPMNWPEKKTWGHIALVSLLTFLV